MSNTIDESGLGPTNNSFGADGGGDVNFPFKGIVQNFGTSEAPSWKAGVYYDSTLYLSQKIDDDTQDLAITGLLASADPADSDPGWFTVADGTTVGIVVVFDGSQTPTSASIANSHSDANWFKSGPLEYQRGGSGTMEDPYVYPPKKAKRILFTVADVGSGELEVRQCIRNDLFLELCQGSGFDSDGNNQRSVYCERMFQD